MAKKNKMPPELLEHFKKKNEGKDEKGEKAKESAEKGLKAAKAAKKYKDEEQAKS